MQATVTLATATLQSAVSAGDRHWVLDSVSGIVPGTRLYHNQELVSVEQINQPAANVVVVRRGVDGTAASAHPGGASLYVGRGDQFYLTDPVGAPANPIAVYPYINVVSGNQWGVLGDDVGPNAGGRRWAPIVISQALGATGQRTDSATAPA